MQYANEEDTFDKDSRPQCFISIFSPDSDTSLFPKPRNV